MAAALFEEGPHVAVPRRGVLGLRRETAGVPREESGDLCVREIRRQGSAKLDGEGHTVDEPDDVSDGRVVVLRGRRCGGVGLSGSLEEQLMCLRAGALVAQPEAFHSEHPLLHEAEHDP